MADNHWADSWAKRIMHVHKEPYTIASGITPSGVIHIGNFRETITVELVGRALKRLGAQVKYYYYWDDYDVFRKVPVDMPKQDALQKELRKPINAVIDPYERDESYARHFAAQVEKALPIVGVKPTIIKQSDKYLKCEYHNEMKDVLEHTDDIKEILDKYRKEPLPDDWLPVSVYCEKCSKEAQTVTYKGEYTVQYVCECKHTDTFDFRKKGLAKFKWRTQWPSWWHNMHVVFEPAGKDHYAAGGSRVTGEEIQKKIWNEPSPLGFMYEWIGIKGGGQFSSSKGNVVTLQDVLQIYEPAIVRYLFASTRPTAEFNISFDLDVLKVYEDFDKCERIYFKAQDAKEKEYEKQKRIYELSCVDEPLDALPIQIPIRHITNVLLINHNDIDKTVAYFKDDLKDENDTKRLQLRVTCAKKWLEKYAPDDFKWEIQTTVTRDISKHHKDALGEVAALLETSPSEKELHNEFYDIAKKYDIEPKEFFELMYYILIDKPKGPKLASFVLDIKEQAISLIKSIR